MTFYGSNYNVPPTPTRINSFSTSSSSLDQSVGRLSSSSLDTPHGLRPLSRSPREILEKKEQMANREERRVNSNNEKIVQVRSMTHEGDGRKNMMEELKMFYTEIIDDLKRGTQAAENGPDLESTLTKKLRSKQEEVEILRKKVDIVDMKKNEKQDELEMVKRDIECLELVMKDEEKSHVDNLVSLQTKIKSCLEEISKIEPSASVTSATDSSLYSKVFPSPLPSTPTPTSGGLLEFSNLFCLSGQLVQFCQGEYGSKLVMDRIRGGTDPERNLVREELDLPRSLGLLMEAGNKYCKDVVLALVERDMRTRVEVMGRVRRDNEIFARIEGGQEFMQRLFNVVGKVNK